LKDLNRELFLSFLNESRDSRRWNRTDGVWLILLFPRLSISFKQIYEAWNYNQNKLKVILLDNRFAATSKVSW
jgi:hypothetical protein